MTRENKANEAFSHFVEKCKKQEAQLDVSRDQTWDPKDEGFPMTTIAVQAEITERIRQFK